MEKDILGHLIQVEHDAASILFDAQVEADKRIADAHLQADNDYKAEYDKLIVRLENAFTLEIDAIDKEQANAFESYKAELQKTEKDLKKFNNLMETLFFGE